MEVHINRIREVHARGMSLAKFGEGFTRDKAIAKQGFL